MQYFFVLLMYLSVHAKNMTPTNIQRNKLNINIIYITLIYIMWCCYVKALIPSWSITYINEMLGRFGANTTSRIRIEVGNPPISDSLRMIRGRSTSRLVRDRLSRQVIWFDQASPRAGIFLFPVLCMESVTCCKECKVSYAKKYNPFVTHLIQMYLVNFTVWKRWQNLSIQLYI